VGTAHREFVVGGAHPTKISEKALPTGGQRPDTHQARSTVYSIKSLAIDDDNMDRPGKMCGQFRGNHFFSRLDFLSTE
jgi:hypothetical protein